MTASTNGGPTSTAGHAKASDPTTDYNLAHTACDGSCATAANGHAIQILPAGGGDWSAFEIIVRSTRHNAMAHLNI